MPQGSVLGPLLFTISINSIVHNVPNAYDAVICCYSPSQCQARCDSEEAFHSVQNKTHDATSSKTKSLNLLSVAVSQGDVTEPVSPTWIRGFRTDDSLCFQLHIQQLVKKLKLWLGFYLKISHVFLLLQRKDLLLLFSFL